MEPVRKAALTWSILALLAASAPALSIEREEALRRNVEIKYRDHCRSVWSLLKLNSLHADKLFPWEFWEHKFEGKIRCNDDQDNAVREMVGSIDDEYTYLRDVKATRAREEAYDEHNVVTHKLLDGRIGYVHISTFASKHTADETKAALQALSSADAFILDLRGNHGGCIEEAFKVCSMFIDQGKFADLKGRWHGDQFSELLDVTATHLKTTTNGSATFVKRTSNLTGHKPVFVLVNYETRSAGEMLAGALRDNHRAELVGSQTFGKGIVQNTWLFDDGTSIKIAIAKYYLPAGDCINGVGLSPEHPITARGDPLPEAASSKDEQLTAALSLVQRALYTARKHREIVSKQPV